MAGKGKVNTKFVAVLVAGLVGVTALGGGAAYFVLIKSGADLARRGDEAVARGDFRAAEKFYSKAVNKEQTNAEFMRKWISAMEQYVPETQSEFEAKYREDYTIAKWLLASRVLRTDMAAYEDYFGMVWREWSERPSNRGVNDDIARQVDEALRNFENQSDPAKPWEKLRRYRGLANLRTFASVANLPEADIARIREDLEAALKADPKDAESAGALLAWYEQKAALSAQMTRDEEAKEWREKGREAFEAATASMADSPYVLLAQTQWWLEDQFRAARALPEDAQRRAAFDTIEKEIGPRLDAIEAAIAAGDLKQTPMTLVVRLQIAEQSFAPRSRFARTLGLLEKMQATRPADPQIMNMRAYLMAQRGGSTPDEIAEALNAAIAEAEKVVALPAKPISLDGLQLYESKQLARYRQAGFAVRLWEAAGAKGDTAGQAAALAKAREYRAELVKLISEAAPQVALIDAQLAMIDKNFGKAQTLLAKYNQDVGDSDEEGLRLMAEASLRVGEPGRARDAFRKLLERQPGDYRAIVRLADVYVTMNNLEEATQYYELAQRIVPDDQDVLQKLSRVREVRGLVESTDPSIKAMLEAEKLEMSGEAAKATALLEEAWKQHKTPRLAAPLAARRSLRGDKAGALTIIDETLKQHPDDVTLKALRLRLTIEDPVEQQLAITDANTSLTPVQRALTKASIYRRAKRPEDFAKWLGEAAKIAPDDPGVIEMQFLDALERKDIGAAERLSDQARDRDLDRVQGATFRARVLLAQGKEVEARRELEAAQSKATFGVEAARFLGDLQAKQQSYEDALKSYRLALSRRPDDRESTLNLVRLLAALDRGNEALTEGRERERYFRSDGEFMDLLLTLEARYGDRNVALVKRRAQIEADPSNRGYQASTISLLMDMRRFPEARQLIDTLRKGGDSLDAVLLDARWHADQMNVAGAQKVFDDYIASLPADKRTPGQFITFGRYMNSIEKPDVALENFRKAQAVQDPKTLEADKALAELFLAQGRLGEAIKSLRQIVDAKADTPAQEYRVRLVDALLRMRQGKDAMTELNAIGQEAIDKDPQLLLQKAEALRQTGDEKGSRQLLDAAVARFPQDPQVYFRRAMANMQDRSLHEEVIKDLTRAIELAPGYWQALRLRAQVHMMSSPPRQDEAIKDMRQAVRTNPRQDELRVSLIRELLMVGRDADALEVAEEVMGKRRGDLALMVNTGDLFRESGRNDQAALYYRQAYEESKQLFVVIRYLEMLQNVEPPNLTEADRVLKELGDSVVSENPALLMARAKQFLRRNRSEEGLRDVVAALRKIPDDRSDMIMAWFSDLTRTAKAREQIPQVLDAVDKSDLKPGWTKYFRAGLLLEQKGEQEKRGVTMLEELAADAAGSRVLRRQAIAALQAKFYQQEDWSNALRLMQKGVEVFPDDWFMLNNYAYTQTKTDPGKACEAMTTAEKAVDLALQNGRENPDVHDTLAWVSVQCAKQKSGAEREEILGRAANHFLRALELSGNAPIRQTVLLHLSEMLMLQNKLTEMESVLSDVETAMRELRTLPGQAEQLEEMKKALADAKAGKR